ncbi:sensor histidine kinase [Clostridium oryzae]|uniref:histidine kinase n=1 Tax=Clostridium oryzae TaxID=1450648 RepID=A0A1V4IVJ0_9CLOT|nr:sensor histidine kinase [Clostridium oryzae]OPJ63956.1 signal-transduction histidine kinase senX3 [Clostridium oryzae]
MKIKIFIDFIKDQVPFTLTFYLSIGTILIYYGLTAHISDIVYPVIIVSTIFIIHLFIEWTKYYSFNLHITDYANSMDNKFFQSTNQQKYFIKVMRHSQQMYLKEISKINSEGNAYRYFFSQWVHNMKTPVSIISLMLQKLENEYLKVQSNDDKKYLADFANGIKDENSKLHNGMEQLLNILRMEQFARDYEPESVDITESLKEVINSKKSLFIYNNVFPQIECNELHVKVLTDEKWNKFMLEQIINNAVKYSAQKGKKKHVKFQVTKLNNRVQLIIEDEGIGIPKSDINRIFEPFFTGENGRKYRDASGIGLYICSLLAKNLNHKIDIQSDEGKGTKATITYFLEH